MEFDTRGHKKKTRDNSKRHNLKEIHERQYRKDQRNSQSQFYVQHVVEADDSARFLKKMHETEEKKLRTFEKHQFYDQEMEKCMPKPKGKAARLAVA